jgi:hypothetical protein
LLFRVFALAFDPAAGRFDDAPVRDYLADKDVAALSEQFFTHDGRPYLAVVVRCHGLDEAVVDGVVDADHVERMVAGGLALAGGFEPIRERLAVVGEDLDDLEGHPTGRRRPVGAGRATGPWKPRGSRTRTLSPSRGLPMLGQDARPVSRPHPAPGHRRFPII